VPLPGAHERVDLDEEGVLADQDLPQPYEDVDGLRWQAGRGSDLARLRRGDALSGVDGYPDDRLRADRGDLLYVHAALGRGDGEEATRGPVEDVGDVELALDVHRLGQHDLADRVSLDVHAEDPACRPLGLAGVGGEPHPARLAPATGLDLRLDDDAAAEPAGDRTGLLGRVGDLGAWHRDSVFFEEGPRLVLVQVHDSAPV
jgi:hypothetical protein